MKIKASGQNTKAAHGSEGLGPCARQQQNSKGSGSPVAIKISASYKDCKLFFRSLLEKELQGSPAAPADAPWIKVSCGSLCTLDSDCGLDAANWWDTS